MRVVPWLPDSTDKHYRWHSRENLLLISVDLFEAMQYVNGVLGGSRMAVRVRPDLPRGYRPTVDDLGLLGPRG
jgi:hypothetical protein